MVIFLNGSTNSGKSTAGNVLAKKLGAEFLDVDWDIRDAMMPDLPLEQAIPLVIAETVKRINTAAENGQDIVGCYPLSRENYETLTRGLKTDMYVFTLVPPLEVALQNRGGRELEEHEKERIRYHYTTHVSNPDFGTIIDNSNETPEETADKILKLVQVGK